MDKKRIGIFLNCNPDWGGQYQYCLSALDALSTLPNDQYEIIAIYAFECWKSICSAYGLKFNAGQLACMKTCISYVATYCFI